MNRVIFKISIALAACMLLSFVVIDKKPRIFLIGDSTIANKPVDVAPETGWGMIFPEYINLEVQNHAVNGRSTKSFRTLGHWSKVYEQLQPGDWVFIQFGHNDSKESDTTRYAPAKTDYRKNLIRYINEIKSKGARPLLITPVMRRKFDEKGNFVDQHGDYPGVVKEVGKEMKVPVLDLHAKSKDAIVQHGVVLGAECHVAFLGRADQRLHRAAEHQRVGDCDGFGFVEPLIHLRHQAGQLLQPGEMRMVGHQLQQLERTADRAEVLGFNVQQLLVQVAQSARQRGQLRALRGVVRCGHVRSDMLMFSGQLSRLAMSPEPTFR